MKMRLLLLSAFTVIFTQLSFAQTAWYDAFALKADTSEIIKTQAVPNGPAQIVRINSFKDLNAALKILQPYTDSAGTGIPFNSQAGIANTFKKNPFIFPYLVSNADALAPTFFSSAVSSVGNLKVTSFADGLAKLIVTRVKADLNTYFFEKFQDFLDNKCPELKALFPHTNLLVNSFASADYANILNTLREAFDKDLHELLVNIPKLNSIQYTGSDPKVTARIAALKAFFSSNDGKIFLSATAIGNGLMSGQKFPDILNTVTTGYLYNWTDPNVLVQANIRGTIDLLSILNTSLRSNDVTASYVSLQQLDSLTKDSVAKVFFLGLLWQQADNMKITIGGTAFTTILANDASGAITYLRNIVQQGIDFSTAVSNLQSAKKKGQSDLSAYYAALFESANQLLTTVQNIQIVNPGFSFPAPVQKIFTYGVDITDIAHDISVRSYNAAVVGLLKYINDIIPAGTNPKLDTAIQKFVKYASFAANVVTAKSSDDVQNAIEAIALPAGSAVTQRNTYFNISINAYGGAFAGAEFMPALKTGRSAWSAGVTAPVGFAFTFGNLGRSNNLKNTNGKSLTLFIPLIDVGALAAFRFQNDSSSTASNVTLKNIIAPGAYLYFGFGKCPLSIGVGAQVGPQLRSINATDINTDKNFYIRYGLDILIDIPLFNLFTNNNHGNQNVFSNIHL